MCVTYVYIIMKIDITWTIVISIPENRDPQLMDKN